MKTVTEVTVQMNTVTKLIREQWYQSDQSDKSDKSDQSDYNDQSDQSDQSD